MIVANKMICPDGHVLQSKRVHDYVEHTDKDGNYFMLDGGTSYVRYSNESGLGKLVTVYDTDDILTIREHMLWGKNYNANKEILPKTEWVLLKDIDDDHLQALIEYWMVKKDNPFYEKAENFINIFLREKQFRYEL